MIMIVLTSISNSRAPDDTYLNMTDFKTSTDKQTKLPTITDNDSESETTLTRSVTPHTFGAVLDSSFTIQNSIFEEEGEGSYVDMGKESSYVDMGKESSYVDMGKESSYVDMGPPPPPLPSRSGRTTLRQGSRSPTVPAKPAVRPATPPKPPPKPSRLSSCSDVGLILEFIDHSLPIKLDI